MWETHADADPRPDDPEYGDTASSLQPKGRDSHPETDRALVSYREKASRVHRKERLRQQAALDDLLAGRGSDPSFAREAAVVLDIPQNACLVCTVALPGDDAAPGWTLASALDAVPHAVSTRRAGIEIALIEDEPRLISRLREVLAGAVGWRVGLSPTVWGLIDVPRGYRLADLAARTAGSGQVVALDESLPEALLAGQDDIRQLIRERTVACLDGLPVGERQTLLATIEALVACDWSPTAAAARLYCHRNTVRYRINVVEGRHGRRIETGRDKLMWALGLLARDELGVRQ